MASGAGAAEDLKPIGSTLLIDASKLKLASANALVFDTQTGQPIYAKGADAVTAIASVTKLMTAMSCSMPSSLWTKSLRSTSAIWTC